MITREMTPELLQAARDYPTVTLTGPRQSGKTTLARACFPELPYVNLEAPDVRAAVAGDPRTFLSRHASGAILDEVQRLPELLSYLQEHVDAHPGAVRFVLTGSHQPLLRQAVGQSLAGRTAMLHLLPFSLGELRGYGELPGLPALLVRGFYPSLHERRLDVRRYLGNYIQSYLERDLRDMLLVKDLRAFQQFLVLLAGRIGQPLNLAALGNDSGISAPTLKSWLSVLEASHVVHVVSPWSTHLRKRLVRAPKVYFTDVGLASHLLGIHREEHVWDHPLRGALFENLVVAEVLKGALNRGVQPRLHHYRDSNGNEVDLLVEEGGRLVPVEIKSSMTFSTEFLTGIEHLRRLAPPNLAGGMVVYAGELEPALRGVRVRSILASTCLWSELTES